MILNMSGLVNMQAVLNNVRDQMQQKGIRRALRAGGKVIREAMQENCPVLLEKSVGSTSLEPGEVRDGISVRMAWLDGEIVALIGPKGKSGDIAHAAHLVEYGHRMVTGGKSRLGVDGVFRGGGVVAEKDVPAHPFLRPAYEASVAEALEVVATTVGEELQEAVQS